MTDDDILANFHNRHACNHPDCHDFGDYGRDQVVAGRRVTVWWCAAHRPAVKEAAPNKPGAAHAVDRGGQQRLI